VYSPAKCTGWQRQKSWFMKVYFDRKVLIGFILTLGILISLGIFSYKNSQDSNVTSNWVSHTNDVLYHIERLHSIHFEIEYELMRFVITGDTTFKSSYRNKLATATEHFLFLREKIKDNASQSARLDSIRDLGRKKLDLINRVIMARMHSVDSAKKIVPSDYNKKLLVSLKTVVEEMRQAEKRLLDERIAENHKEVSKFYATFITLLIVTVVIMSILFLAINATLRSRLNAERALQIASAEIKDLYDNAPCGYHSLDGNGTITEMNRTWLEWIGLERDDVIQKMTFMQLLTPKSQEVYKEIFPLFKTKGHIHNLELEVPCKNNTILFVILNATSTTDEKGNLVKSQSTVFNITERRIAEEKVVETNKELEAFTYSVSHDLRAPLRSIDGYSRILQEDYGSKLDEEGNRILKIIRRNAHRMGQLIEDLLNFARLGRKELEKTRLNMNVLVDNVKQELMTNENKRTIEFIVRPLEEIYGDSSMMRQVWINLISNALKYSKRQEVPKIEIGCNQEETRTIYYIRDNGVGFDMAYADKLFGVFQRLHKMEEFDGTGVGLALVHRIVSRHGGKIWAESQVNQGATFFFFIPSQNPI
jgi:PAS domain S-box-containing protein